jgi:hypothetical protein
MCGYTYSMHGGDLKDVAHFGLRPDSVAVAEHLGRHV